MDDNKRYRLAILMSHPIHYLMDFYRELNKNSEAEVMVYFCSDFGIKAGLDKTFGQVVKWYDETILEGLPHKFLKNYSPNKTVSGFFSVINPGIVSELKRSKYDAVIIHGYAFMTNLIALFAARFFRIPILLRGESNLLNYRSPLIYQIKKIILPFIFKRVAAFLAIGSLNSDYYRFYGVPNNKIFPTPYAVNNENLQKLASALTPAKKQALKRTFGLHPNLPVILYLSKMIARKRPLDLLRVYQRIIAEGGQGAQLVFIGAGPEKILLEAYVKKHKIPNVHFFGFTKPEAVADWYTLADIFVLPSAFETWGVVINEAMNFSLPVISTDQVGASYDLVKNEYNGFIYRSGDIEELKNRLLKLIRDKELRMKMAGSSLESINKWSFKEAIAGVLTALKSITKRQVVVINPGSHHLWRTALAFKETGLLKYYATNIYCRPHSLSAKIFKFLRRRGQGNFLPEEVKTFEFYEWLHLIAARLLRSKKIASYFINKRNEFLGRKIGPIAKREAKVVWAALDGAKEAFLLSKPAGVICILDQFMGYPTALNKILEKETEIFPELKTVIKDLVSTQKLKRLKDEIDLADFIVVGSEFAKQTLLENGIPAQKISVIPYGAEDVFFKVGANSGKNDKFFNILFVGNISVRKGCHYLLEAIKEINSPKLKLAMVGQMEDNYFLKKFGNYFEWIPQVSREQIPEFYAQADIFVYPSLFEGSSLSIYEALASGLPVITTENSGSVIRDKKDGFIVPIRDATALKEKIILLYHDKKLREKMSQNARQTAENYRWATYQKRVATIIDAILAKNINEQKNIPLN